MKNKNNDKPLILIVDDVYENIQVLGNILKNEKLDFAAATNGNDAIQIIKESNPDIVLLDLFMPGMSGEELLKIISAEYPHISVIIITFSNKPETIVDCMKNGAFDFLVKPVDKVRTITAVNHALKDLQQEKEITLLKEQFQSEELEEPETFSGFITKNKSVIMTLKYIESIAKTQQPVLITGETGTGKGLIAQAVHDASNRKGQFVSVNIAGLDESLFTDTLFGHKKGSFTGANEARSGLVEKAANGTLFIDEIGDLDKASQVKLLRLLQEGDYLPVGSDMPKQCHARIVLATHQNLEEQVENGTFRKDLYYRLKSHRIKLPPLRENTEDIHFLLEHFLKQASEEMDKKKPTYPVELLTLLKAYNFPGNTRELRGMVFEAMVRHSGGILSMNAFKENISDDNLKISSTRKASSSDWVEQFEILPSLKEASNQLIKEAMKRADNNQGMAANMLGLTRAALCKRLKREEI